MFERGLEKHNTIIGKIPDKKTVSVNESKDFKFDPAVGVGIFIFFLFIILRWRE